jgi:predicted DNA binding CopG/RHH family protein
MKKDDFIDSFLDEEEKEISEAINRDELKSIPHVEKEIARAKKIAENTLRKNARVSIRLSEADLVRLKQKAADKGLSYQAFIASVLHEYATGTFDKVA